MDLQHLCFVGSVYTSSRYTSAHGQGIRSRQLSFQRPHLKNDGEVFLYWRLWAGRVWQRSPLGQVRIATVYSWQRGWVCLSVTTLTSLSLHGGPPAILHRPHSEVLPGRALPSHSCQAHSWGSMNLAGLRPYGSSWSAVGRGDQPAWWCLAACWWCWILTRALLLHTASFTGRCVPLLPDTADPGAPGLCWPDGPWFFSVHGALNPDSPCQCLCQEPPGRLPREGQV